MQGKRITVMDRQGVGLGNQGCQGCRQTALATADIACKQRTGQIYHPAPKRHLAHNSRPPQEQLGQLTRQRLGLDGQRALKAALLQHIQDAGAQAALHWEGGGVRGGTAAKAQIDAASIGHVSSCHPCSTAPPAKMWKYKARQPFAFVAATRTWCQFFTGLGTFLPRTCNREAGRRLLDRHSGDGHVNVKCYTHSPQLVVTNPHIHSTEPAHLHPVQLSAVLLHLLLAHARQLRHLNVEGAPAREGGRGGKEGRDKVSEGWGREQQQATALHSTKARRRAPGRQQPCSRARQQAGSVLALPHLKGGYCICA